MVVLVSASGPEALTPGPEFPNTVVSVSLLFSAAHHWGPQGDTPDGFVFLFRCVAGVFFSILFIHRGYGIAAGSHAGYNLLVGVFRV